MEFNEDETFNFNLCRDCGAPVALTSRQRNPFMKDVFGMRVIGMLYLRRRSICIYCMTDVFFLSDTPGMHVVHSLREKFRNGELTHDEFTYLEEEALAGLLQIEFDDVSIPKEVEIEVLAYLASLESDTSLAIKSVFSDRPNLKESASIPTSYVFRNWNPQTSEATFKVDLFEIILMFRHEVPRPLTAMWRRY